MEGNLTPCPRNYNRLTITHPISYNSVGKAISVRSLDQGRQIDRGLYALPCSTRLNENTAQPSIGIIFSRILSGYSNQIDRHYEVLRITYFKRSCMCRASLCCAVVSNSSLDFDRPITLHHNLFSVVAHKLGSFAVLGMHSLQIRVPIFRAFLSKKRIQHPF